MELNSPSRWLQHDELSPRDACMDAARLPASTDSPETSCISEGFWRLLMWFVKPRKKGSLLAARCFVGFVWLLLSVDLRSEPLEAGGYAAWCRTPTY